MTNSRIKAIPSSTYVAVRIYPTILWQVKIWSVSFQYAPHLHDVSLPSPVKGIERKIPQLLPVSEVLYSTELTYKLSMQFFQSLNIPFLGWTPQLATVIHLERINVFHNVIMGDVFLVLNVRSRPTHPHS